MLFMSYGGGLVDQFEFIVEISVFAALVPYLLTAAAYILIIIEKKLHANSWIKTFVLGGLGFMYSLWAIWGSGRDTVFYGFMLLLSGIPFYLVMMYNKRQK
jgi:APA family basic amino acid/polyamine antiporter